MHRKQSVTYAANVWYTAIHTTLLLQVPHTSIKGKAAEIIIRQYPWEGNVSVMRKYAHPYLN